MDVLKTLTNHAVDIGIVIGQVTIGALVPRYTNMSIGWTISFGVFIGLLYKPLRWLLSRRDVQAVLFKSHASDSRPHWQEPRKGVRPSLGIGSGGTFGDVRPMVFGEQWIDNPPNLPEYTVHDTIATEQRMDHSRFSNMADTYEEDTQFLGGYDAERVRKMKGLEVGLHTSDAFR